MNWEKIDDCSRRAKVHSGWLVRVLTKLDNGEAFISVVYVPDPMYAWKINEK